VGAEKCPRLYKLVARARNLDQNIIQALCLANDCTAITPRARKSLAELGDILGSLRKHMDSATVAGLIDSLIRRIDYLNFLDDGGPQGEAR
jgi:superfamily I DNA/RNA helicase